MRRRNGAEIHHLHVISARPHRFLYVSLWGGGKVQQCDIRDRRKPTLVSEMEIPQPNMMKLSPDSRRLYVRNSILSSPGA